MAARRKKKLSSDKKDSIKEPEQLNDAASETSFEDLIEVDEEEINRLIAEVEDSAGVERSRAMEALPSLDAEFSTQGDEQEDTTIVAADPSVLGNAEEDSEEQKPPRKWLRRLLSVLAVLVGVVAGVYFGGVAYFAQHTLPNTTVNGRDMSLVSVDNLAGVFDYELSTWKAKVEGDGINMELDARAAGLSTDSFAYARYVVSSTNPWKWPVEIQESHNFDIELKANADREKLTNAIEPELAQANSLNEDLENGGIYFNADTQRFEVPDEILRGKVDLSSVVDTIMREVTSLPNHFSLGDNCLVADDAVIAALDSANTILDSCPMTLTMADKVIYELSKEEFSQWVRFDENLNVSIDKEALDGWTHGPFAQVADTLEFERSFTRADGKEITIPGGTYGWMSDGNAVTEAILSHAYDGEPASIVVPTLSEAEIFNPGGREWRSYIDVDLSEQHVRWYDDDDNLIWESDCVTGQPVGKDYYGNTVSYATPTGAYFVNNKETDKKMRGPWIPELDNWEYEVPARLWLPFLYDSWALHDVSSRYYYGGNIYTYAGSHGCVNIPYDNLVYLFDNVEVGEPVIVHD